MTRFLILAALALLAGCSCTSGAAQDVPVFPRVPMPWTERGQWSDATSGVRARTCLGFAETRELPWIGVALTASDGSVCLGETGSPPFNGGQGVQVLLDGQPVETQPSYPLKTGEASGPGTITIPREHVLMVGPVSLTARPADGEHTVEVVYTVTIEDEQVELRSPPLAFTVPYKG